ncbi:hypothetical protein BDP81DRAFT_16076 [Colletotrichum phormii]|uniref:Uncharacterized protein n=1 Tax=Colletotrichum phormii TaxID=359342 RepID=A0AAJ0A589_9PEZI|nr:uncharacterized protein BDP81DRAFT_16076 [Colletotrichum phormii]KAK1656138.1 hypothetical protein BDP81DRAFT_16076 [Colletotrichum phormii]
MRVIISTQCIDRFRNPVPIPKHDPSEISDPRNTIKDAMPDAMQTTESIRITRIVARPRPGHPSHSPPAASAAKLSPFDGTPETFFFVFNTDTGRQQRKKRRCLLLNSASTAHNLFAKMTEKVASAQARLPSQFCSPITFPPPMLVAALGRFAKPHCSRRHHTLAPLLFPLSTYPPGTG